MIARFRRLRVNITDVGAELLDVLFMGIGNDRTVFRASVLGCTRAALYMDRVFGRREGLVALVLDVEIAELNGRNGVVARAARNSQILNRFGAADA